MLARASAGPLARSPAGHAGHGRRHRLRDRRRNLPGHCRPRVLQADQLDPLTGNNEMFRWYVVNTYSGHENKVKHNLEHRVVSLNQQRSVRQIVVPTETVSEMKDNQKVMTERRTMPGYVLVQMDLNEDSWSLVK